MPGSLHVDMGVLDDMTIVSTASSIGIAFRLSRPGVPGADPAVGPVPENILTGSVLRVAAALFVYTYIQTASATASKRLRVLRLLRATCVSSADIGGPAAIDEPSVGKDLFALDRALSLTWSA